MYQQWKKLLKVHRETPVKPKRKKGKKKKQDELFDDQKMPDNQENSTDNTLNVTEPSIQANSDVENDTKPETAKRKKKKKKQTEKCFTEEITEPVKTESEVNTEISIKSDPIPQTPESTPKKKHKKKKPPADSAKTEDVTCISAFQQLLEPGDSQEETVRPESQNNDSLPEVLIDKCEEKVEDIQQTKNKKKNKKHRKHSPAVIQHDEDKKQPQEGTVELMQEKCEVKPTSEISEVSQEASPKPKAKIAKPVDKKHKNKNTKTSTNVDNNSTPEDAKIDQSSLPGLECLKKDDNVLIQAKSESLKTTNNIKQSEPSFQNVIIGPADTEKEKCDKTVNVEKVIESPQIAPQTEQEQIKESDNTSFTEVRPSRKKKRSAKSISEQSDGEKAPSVTIDVSSQNEPKTEQIEDTNITPDFIHYPRSSSQQQFDSNNNTVIQEIHSPDEVRLGIPIFMSVPVVEGSGESPEVRSQMDPLDVEVTELKMSDLKTEDKNVPIPAKTVDETLVMEELKLSIEKSLAELTAIEKGEIEVEKKLVDVKQDNLHSPVNAPIETALENITPANDGSKIVDIPKEEVPESPCSPPVCPARKDKKGKSKKKGKKGATEQASSTTTVSSSNTAGEAKKDTQDTSSKDKDTKSENTQKKEKQQSTGNTDETEVQPDSSSAFEVYYEPIENFEDALTSSNEDINKTFEMIAKEVYDTVETKKPTLPNPEISITEPEEDRQEKNAKEHPVSQPKNLLGQPNIPASSNKDDYKKEKDKPPNSMQAKVKIKDSVDVEKSKKRSKESQTQNKSKHNSNTYKINENDDFVYKYSFRTVFLPNICHVCNKDLTTRVPCKFCNLLFYCSQKHKDEDWPKHQSLCFAICTIAHLKEQKFIYGAAKNITGQDYRLLRMQVIMSCEKMLKRKLLPWEQEALLYPRICSNTACREWRQGYLTDCRGCGQVAFCTDHPEHLPVSHQQWCKSYALYQKLVMYQQTKGRLEPCLPSKVMTESYVIPEKINEVLASLYEEKIEMDDIQYATLTQIASAPLTTAYGYQMCRKNANGLNKRSTFSIHIVGAELQFEADVLNKWERFFLHLRPDIKDLRIVLISPNLNPSNLPLDLLRNVKLCEQCRCNNRRLLFSFEDKKTYFDYYTSEDFIHPDIVCAFNPSIERSSIYNGKDPWPATLKCVAKLKSPLLITAYTLDELNRDLSRVQKYSFEVLTEPKYNNFASIRPDRNFITDDEIPLLFKNYCFSVVCGV
ncbi:unnamed protein product [Colias eurytheme]|nr:unnamed protein product [Colias eurytheme]